MIARICDRCDGRIAEDIVRIVAVTGAGEREFCCVSCLIVWAVGGNHALAMGMDDVARYILGISGDRTTQPYMLGPSNDDTEPATNETAAAGDQDDDDDVRDFDESLPADDAPEEPDDAIAPEEPQTPPADPPVPDRLTAAGNGSQDAVKRTCEVCGREGTRRFVETETGWKCSPTATACAPRFRPPGTVTPRPRPKPKPPSQSGYGDIPENIPASPTSGVPTVPVSDSGGDHDATAEADHPAATADCSEPQIPAAVGTPPASDPRTAQCRDCTRSFTLTGRVLDSAIEMHELKRGHIVDVFTTSDAS